LGCESVPDNRLPAESRPQSNPPSVTPAKNSAPTAAASTPSGPEKSEPAVATATSETANDVTDDAPNEADATNDATAAALNQVFKDLGGQQYTINNLKGKVVLVVYWATWCGPCKREIPVLNELYDRYRQKNVVFLAISQDDERTTLEDFLQTDKAGQTIKYPIIYGAPYTKIFGRVSAIPTLVLLDKQGKPVGKHEGTAPADTIAQAIEKYL
jgi:thiol-disulfide isomerase/thioredoxin